MKKPGFASMKAFFALSSLGRGDHVDWMRVVAIWSSLTTVALIVLYVLQRSN
jgi:hypothetical protein